MRIINPLDKISLKTLERNCAERGEVLNRANSPARWNQAMNSSVQQHALFLLKISRVLRFWSWFLGLVVAGNIAALIYILTHIEKVN